jgi:hypothetical protein
VKLPRGNEAFGIANPKRDPRSMRSRFPLAHPDRDSKPSALPRFLPPLGEEGRDRSRLRHRRILTPVRLEPQTNRPRCAARAVASGGGERAGAPHRRQQPLEQFEREDGDIKSGSGIRSPTPRKRSASTGPRSLKRGNMGRAGPSSSGRPCFNGARLPTLQSREYSGPRRAVRTVNHDMVMVHEAPRGRARPSYENSPISVPGFEELPGPYSTTRSRYRTAAAKAADGYG